jgi:hypothetical protein
MTPDLNRLMDNCRIRLPGVVDDILKLELYSVLNDFFQNSNSWNEDITFTVTPEVLEYPITPSGVSKIVRLVGVVNSDESYVGAVMPESDTITLLISPNQTGVYTARVVLTISDPLTRDGYPEYPDWVLGSYLDEIIDGVLGRAMSQVAKPYSNERMAIYHTRRFRAGVARAKVEWQHKLVYRGQNWSFPQTFARRHSR